MSLRPATISDAPFIAVSVLDAVGIESPDDALLERITAMCRRTDVLYSWKQTIIAEIDGEPVGSLTSYAGDDYASLRRVTFDLVYEQSGQDFRTMDQETQPGEYYLDSLSVRPPFRHRGIATALMRAGIEHATELGIETVTLACDPTNAGAYNLYCAMGFRHEGELFIFGENYWRMELKLQAKRLDY